MRAVLLALAALLALTFGSEVRLGAQAFDLQAEIDACPSFGCVIDLPYGVLLISTPITAYGHDNLTIRGKGAYHDPSLATVPAVGTVLKWDGANCACPLLSVGKANGVKVLDLSIDARKSNSIEADYALQIVASKGGEFSDLHLMEGRVASMDWTTIHFLEPVPPTGAESSRNRSVNVSVRNHEAIPVRMDSRYLTATTSGNVHHNVLEQYWIRHRDTVGFWCGNADGNQIHGLDFFTAGTTKPYVLELRGSTTHTDGRGACRGNVFDFVSHQLGGIVSRATGLLSPAQQNVATNIAKENTSQPTPVIEPGSTLYWNDLFGGGNR